MAKLGSAVARTGARLLFLRHGETRPGAASDFVRMLSDKGRRQARLAGESFGTALDPYCLALASTASRCVETAERFLGTRETRIVTSAALYDDCYQPGASEVFRRIGYAPLADYIVDGESVDALDTYAVNAVDAIVQALENNVPELRADDAPPPPRRRREPPRQTLLVCGHAVYLSATALQCAGLLGAPSSAQRLILDTTVGECSGFLLTPAVVDSENNNGEPFCSVRFFQLDDDPAPVLSSPLGAPEA